MKCLRGFVPPELLQEGSLMGRAHSSERVNNNNNNNTQFVLIQLSCLELETTLCFLEIVVINEGLSHYYY